MSPIYIFVLLATLWSPRWSQAAEQHPPNIIYLLADDLGYGDLGSYGHKLSQAHVESTEFPLAAKKPKNRNQP